MGFQPQMNGMNADVEGMDGDEVTMDGADDADGFDEGTGSNRMDGMLRRYLIEYDSGSYEPGDLRWVPMWVGVTGYSLEDALNVVARWVLQDDVWPRVKRVVVDYDPGAKSHPWADGENALRMTGVSVWRGVWLPMFNLFYGVDEGHGPPLRPGARRVTEEELEIYTRSIVGQGDL